MKFAVVGVNRSRASQTNIFSIFDEYGEGTNMRRRKNHTCESARLLWVWLLTKGRLLCITILTILTVTLIRVGLVGQRRHRWLLLRVLALLLIVVSWGRRWLPSLHVPRVVTHDDTCRRKVGIHIVTIGHYHVDSISIVSSVLESEDTQTGYCVFRRRELVGAPHAGLLCLLSLQNLHTHPAKNQPYEGYFCTR